jgi:hypothetical protein
MARVSVETPARPALPPRELTFDLPCVACRYNLRGLNSPGNCPECGAPIEPSLWQFHSGPLRYGPWLRESDPEWVRWVAQGILGLMLCAIASILSAALLGLALDGGSSMLRRVALITSVAIWIIDSTCLWRLGRKEPGRFAAKTADRELALRLAAAGSVALLLLSAWIHLDSGTFFLVLALWSPTTTCLTFLRIRDLVRRLPPASLRGEAAILVWLLTVLSAARIFLLPAFSDASSGNALIFFATISEPGVPVGPTDFYLAVFAATRRADFAMLLLTLTSTGITIWSLVFLARSASALFAEASESERQSVTVPGK